MLAFEFQKQYIRSCLSRTSWLHCIISKILSFCYNSNTLNYHIGVAMEPAMEQLNIHSTSEAFENYLETFEIWSMTEKDVESDKIVEYFPTFVGKEAYSLLKTLA
ncbi:hypothetical protein MS3_00001167 [Schistosoma haematobium]|uniref:Uncharacterized protein n=1 Tax=Schistosoma haematobium TaxID=6185 RepID=A0A922LQF3_SCHHA|nr:hypothetical protein MS3_00001167 [Schistosoma haematobium]KAH9591345.1 hypothetical protein MS3_00001167 [Schistosoma haematobium]